MKIVLNRIYLNTIFPNGQFIDKRIIIIFGGRRSSKSYDVCQMLQIIAMSQVGHKIALARKVYRSTKDTIFAEHEDFVNRTGLSGVVKVNRSNDDRAFYHERTTGSSLKCFGLDNPEKMKSLAGYTKIHLEEATEFTEDDFDSLNTGLSPTHYKGQMILTFNPIPQIPGQEHWIQRRFPVKQAKLGQMLLGDDFAILKTNFEHNYFCPKETIKLLYGYKETRPDLWEMWGLGNFTKLEGLVFEYELKTEVPEEARFLGYGLDFGYTDPNACPGVWVDNERMELYVKGFVYGSNMSPDDLTRAMQKAKITHRSKIIGDSSNPMMISEVKKFFPCIQGVKKSKGYKEDTINVIKNYKLFLIAGDMNLQREFSTYQWATDKQGERLSPAKVQDGNDHYIDAFIMVVHTLLQKPLVNPNLGWTA